MCFAKIGRKRSLNGAPLDKETLQGTQLADVSRNSAHGEVTANIYALKSHMFDRNPPQATGATFLKHKATSDVSYLSTTTRPLLLHDHSESSARAAEQKDESGVKRKRVCMGEQRRQGDRLAVLGHTSTFLLNKTKPPKYLFLSNSNHGLSLSKN
jgi:hypothetical protein